MSELKQKEKESFDQIKNSFLDFDPAFFIENNLTIDGSDFRIIGNGWKFMVDVYRYIGLQATQKSGKPVVIKKGRQVGATMMAAAIDLFFTNSGLFHKPPIRVLHAFPSLGQVKKFSQDKLEGFVRTSKNGFISKNKLEGNSVDNLTMKQFKSGTLWVDSIGEDGDRIRGMTVDAIFFDECFPYETYIEVEGGKIQIGEVFELFSAGSEIPLIKSYNEKLDIFEYKKIKNAWNRGEKNIIELQLGNRTIRCTPNHKFLTTSGWIEARNLRIGSLIIISPSTKTFVRDLNSDQLQIVLGSFLGDGHIDSIKNNKYRLSVTHGIDQSEYCRWKASFFDSSIVNINKNGFSESSAIKFTTKSFGLSGNFPSTKSTCPQWVLDSIDARGMAIWFMDDGSIKRWNNSGSGCISTCSFDEDSQKRFVEKFNSLGIKSHYKKYKASNGNEYFSIYLNKDGFKKLSKLIAPYIHNNISYKILNDEDVIKYEWNEPNKITGLTSVDSIKYLSEKKIVYDIEVEDNHNFIVTTSKTSKNLGGVIAHNCQDMFATAIGNATKTLTAAKYGPVGQGVQVYFGTPKEKSSYFASLWDMSDQRYYHLGCKNCKETFPFYLPDDKRWMDIWVSGHTIRCPLCSCEQHKVEAIERGKWVPSRNPDECKLVGFHINQLYIPYFTKENILNLMPENNPLQTERIFKNEVVGEFFSGAGLPITRAEIYEKCRDADRAFSKTISAKEKSSYLGVDWGGKDDGSDSNVGQSYSCVVILSALPDGTLLVEHAHKLRKQDFDYKKETIHEMYKRFGVKQGLSDWFFGQDVVHDLQRHYGSRFLGAQGSGNLLKPLKFREDELIVSYNKDMMVEEIFDLFRKGKIRFPWKSFEYIEWLIDHCTSMESSIKTVGGQPIKTYSKGSGPNDGLMALMYAYMAYKFDATKGFSIKPGINGNEQSAPRPVLAHLKRRM